jgi:GntR family transcriptional regulator, transcriptional repressor for pyruvate dehydrogenase complex
MTGLSTPPDREGTALRIEQELIQEHPEGSRLPGERQVAERLGVSRPLVREALRGLAERGLVEVVPGRGTFTRRVRTSDAARPLDSLLRREATPRHLVEARLMLECEAISLAAQRATPGEIAAMATALQQFDAAPDALSKARFDMAFHMLIAQSAHNPAIEVMFTALASSTLEIMVRSLSDPRVLEEGASLHHAMLDAVRAHDPDGARAAMAEHVGLALLRYGDDVDRPIDTIAQREIAKLLGPGMTVDGVLDTVRRLSAATTNELLPP